jgi:hypothetical protein
MLTASDGLGPSLYIRLCESRECEKLIGKRRKKERKKDGDMGWWKKVDMGNGEMGNDIKKQNPKRNHLDRGYVTYLSHGRPC